MSRSRYAQIPQETAEEEMYAAFDNGDDEDDAHNDQNHQPSQPLLSSQHRREQSWHPLESTSVDTLNSSSDNYPTPTRHAPSRSVSQPGTYDFEYDYAMLPPPGSPPRPSQLALPNAYGNTNGLLPTSPPLATAAPTPSFLRRAFGAILPTHYAHDRRGGGLGNDGVFGNVVAKPGGPGATRGTVNDPEGPYMIPEDAQKDAPPSYQAAQLDSVPPYWENTILAPSGPFDGDMVIDNLPVGSVFAFLWNLLVSVSFQFVGFLLTYLLHTTHAGKYGARAGLGVTLIQYGFALRDPDNQIPVADGDSLWGWPDPTTDGAGENGGGAVTVTRNVAAAIAKRAFPIVARAITVYTNGTTSTPDNVGPKGPFTTSIDNNNPSSTSPSIGAGSSLTPNDWFSFMLMTLGWFLLITSFLGYWRVKRWEQGVMRSVASTAEREQRERDPTPDDLVRNAQVLRNLEQAFGIQWDMEARAGTGVVSPTMQPGSAAAGRPPPPPLPPADGGLLGLSTALGAAPPGSSPPERASRTGTSAAQDDNASSDDVERSTRQGTRRLFRLQF